jgi:hypothetical protein
MYQPLLLYSRVVLSHHFLDIQRRLPPVAAGS